MKNGLYALASLDGAPLARGDLAIMGLQEAMALAAPGCVLLPRDVRAAAVTARSYGDGIDALLGYLDEPVEAARALGLPADTGALTIVLTAVERFGADAPGRLRGAWLLARWDAHARALSLTMAERVRDGCYVASDGRRVAVSPELARLARLDWVDAAPDPTALLMSVGRARLRGALGNRTVLRDVHRALPGDRMTVGRDGVRIAAAPPVSEPSAARPVSFDEAVGEFDRILRRIVKQLLVREGDVALALSGGLDSSLLALYATEERGDARLTFLTSASPPGSDLPDESGFASIVASHLGVPLEKVSPPRTADVYRPSTRVIAQFETPLMSVRHYLDEALEQAAIDGGARALLDGTGGELTVTNYGYFLARPRPLRDAARALRDRWKRQGDAEPWPRAGFHVRLSSAALAGMLGDLREIWETARPPHRRPRPHHPLGFEPGALRAAEKPSWSVDPALRTLSPFYDRRLLLHAAAIPAALVGYLGRDRALARALMKERLPDSITDRQTRMPYSPTYQVMLAQQASAARARLPLFRAEEAGEWIDLVWLDGALSKAAVRRLTVNEMFDVQQTIMFAEYLIWWRKSSIGR